MIQEQWHAVNCFYCYGKSAWGCVGIFLHIFMLQNPVIAGLYSLQNPRQQLSSSFDLSIVFDGIPYSNINRPYYFRIAKHINISITLDI